MTIDNEMVCHLVSRVNASRIMMLALTLKV